MIAEATVKCRRHVWCYHTSGRNSFDRSICAADAFMHTRCDDCGHPMDGECAVKAGCLRCRAVRDEAIVKRNRRNRQRGGSFERRTAKLHGGRRTGPLGGRDDVVTDAMFAIQTKRAQRFSLNEARTYLADLHRTFPTRTPYVVHALPGERYGVVVIDERDWLALHGPAATEEPA